MKLSGVAVTDNGECLKPVEFVNICSHKEKVKIIHKNPYRCFNSTKPGERFPLMRGRTHDEEFKWVEDVAAREMEVSSVKHPVTKCWLAAETIKSLY